MKKYSALCIILLLTMNVAYAQNNLSLESSKTFAIQNNIKIKNAQLELEAAREVRQAAFTKFFPSINVTGLLFKSPENLMQMQIKGGNLPVYDGNPANLANATQFAYFPESSMGILKNATIGMINIVQPLYAGGRIMNGNKLAALGENVSQSKLYLAKNEVLLKTEEQYWQIVALNEKLKTIHAYNKLLENLLRQIEDAYASGLVGKNDVLKVKLKRSEVLLNQSKLENGIKLASMAFCQYIGISYDSTMILTSTLNITEIKPVDHTIALQKRTEYQLLQAGIAAEELQTQLKLGEYLPQVGIGFNELYLQMDSGSAITSGIVYGSVQIPISNWWEASHKLTEQNKKEQMAKNNLKDTSELLLLQMEKAWQDVTDAKKQVALNEEALAQAIENLKVNQDSYTNGLITVSDLLEAQAMLQNTQDQLIESKAQYQIKQFNYLQITGRITLP